MIILASASPRRQELLKEILDEFEIVVANVDEEALVDPDPVVTARRTASAKANAVIDIYRDAIVIGADTVVAIDGEQLAKPVDEADAFRMLCLLSGKTHTVITGVCIAQPTSPLDSVFDVQSRVTFRELSDDEIWAYIATGEPWTRPAHTAHKGRPASTSRGLTGRSRM